MIRGLFFTKVWLRRAKGSFVLFYHHRLHGFLLMNHRLHRFSDYTDSSSSPLEGELEGGSLKGFREICAICAICGAKSEEYSNCKK